jgi:antitoxin component of RelBE/YafQ-DinJ toxin-antitoxin module
MTLARNQFIACRLPSDLKERVEDYAKRNDLTVSQIVRRELKNVVDQKICDRANTAKWLI